MGTEKKNKNFSTATCEKKFFFFDENFFSGENFF
jgi:hypothetical protein